MIADTACADPQVVNLSQEHVLRLCATAALHVRHKRGAVAVALAAEIPVVAHGKVVAVQPPWLMVLAATRIVCQRVVGRRAVTAITSVVQAAKAEQRSPWTVAVPHAVSQ